MIKVSELVETVQKLAMPDVLIGSEYKVGGPAWDRIVKEYPEHITYMDAMDIRRRSVN